MTAPPPPPPPHQGYPPPPPQQTPAGYGAPPPPWLSETRPRPARPSAALGVVALVLGVVALAISWVPWVNLMGLLLALGGLGIGVFAAVRRRGAARGMGIGGAAASLLALGVVLVLLAVSAVGFLHDSADSADSAGPTASSPAEPSDPGASPSPAPSDPGVDPDTEVIQVDQGEEMALGDLVGTIEDVGFGAVWADGADSATEPPVSASLDYRLVLRKDGDAIPSDEPNIVGIAVEDSDGNALTSDACEVDAPEEGSLPASASIQLGCVDLPVDFDGTVFIRVTIPSVPGTPVYAVVGDVAIDDVR